LSEWKTTPVLLPPRIAAGHQDRGSGELDVVMLTERELTEREPHQATRRQVLERAD